MGKQSKTMKRLICILASAALLGACEQKTEVTPTAPAEKKESNTTIVNPPANTEKTKEKTTTNTITNAAPADSVEKKSETTTTTSSSPNP